VPINGKKAQSTRVIEGNPLILVDLLRPFRTLAGNEQMANAVRPLLSEPVLTKR